MTISLACQTITNSLWISSSISMTTVHFLRADHDRRPIFATSRLDRVYVAAKWRPTRQRQPSAGSVLLSVLDFLCLTAHRKAARPARLREHPAGVSWSDLSHNRNGDKKAVKSDVGLSSTCAWLGMPSSHHLPDVAMVYQYFALTGFSCSEHICQQKKVSD